MRDFAANLEWKTQRFLGFVVGRACTLFSFFDSCDTSQHPRRRTLVAVPGLYSLNVCCVKQNRDKSGATRKKARDQIRGRTYEICRRLKCHRWHEWIGWKRIGETFRCKLDSCEFNSTIVPYLCYGRYKHGLVSDRFDALILCRVLCFRFGVPRGASSLRQNDCFRVLLHSSPDFSAFLSLVRAVRGSGALCFECFTFAIQQHRPQAVTDAPLPCRGVIVCVAAGDWFSRE